MSTRTIEEDRGTYTGRPAHRHDGYYAGDFSAAPAGTPARPRRCLMIVAA